MVSVQIPTQELPYGPYSSRLRVWSSNYDDVLTIERDSDTGFRYVVISDDALVPVPGSLSSVLGLSPQVILDYMDDQVVQGHNPPGANLISRWYWFSDSNTGRYLVMPWQYLYRTVEDLGAVAPV